MTGPNAAARQASYLGHALQSGSQIARRKVVKPRNPLQSRKYQSSSTIHSGNAVSPLSNSVRLPFVPISSSSRIAPNSALSTSSSSRNQSTSSSSSSFSTINPSEISHFSKLSSEWWSESSGSEFALLHRMNPTRIEYLRQFVALDPRYETPWTFSDRHNDRRRTESRGEGYWLKGKRVLDVGCGGGLLSESLARLGGDVLGIDASEQNIGMAIIHASQDDSLNLRNTLKGQEGEVQEKKVERSDNKPGSLEYRFVSAEQLRDEGEKFDLVCGMEVVEHVDEPAEFMRALGDMVKPGGHLVLSTISRTPLSRLLTLTFAEDVLRLVTPGTHTYSKFITPTELKKFVWSDMGGHEVWEHNNDASDIKKDQVGESRGIIYNPLKGKWSLWEGAEGTYGKEVGELCNYMYGAKKRLI